MRVLLRRLQANCNCSKPYGGHPAAGAPGQFLGRQARTHRHRSPLLEQEGVGRPWGRPGGADCGDVADYVRFRTVCRSWRRCSVDPRAHDCLDRRFHPRRWIMLQLQTLDVNPSSCCRFLNTSTAECIQVDVPELHDHGVLARTCEGLLLLLHLHDDRSHVRLLNPLNGHLAQLPPLTTLLPQAKNVFSSRYGLNSSYISACGSGIADDDSTVVLCFRYLHVIGVAKPGDVSWTLVPFDHTLQSCSMFAGRFYCVTRDGVMVLVLEDHVRPRLELAAEIPMMIPSMSDTAHLVDCDGQLMLVHRTRKHARGNNVHRTYDMYRVDLNAGSLRQVKSFGGGRHALFVGMSFSLSVPVKTFPSGSIRGNTIYLSFDVFERRKIQGYDLAKRRTIGSCKTGLVVTQPHTLLDCLSLCSTDWIWNGYI